MNAGMKFGEVWKWDVLGDGTGSLVVGMYIAPDDHWGDNSIILSDSDGDPVSRWDTGSLKVGASTAESVTIIERVT